MHRLARPVVSAQEHTYDNYSVEVYLDNAQYTTVASNFFYSTGNTRYYRGGEPPKFTDRRRGFVVSFPCWRAPSHPAQDGLESAVFGLRFGYLR